MHRLHHVAFCVLLIAAIGCTKDQTTTDQAAESADAETMGRQTYTEIVNEINERIPSLHVVTGKYASGDATSEYRAYYDDNGSLLFIHEHQDLGEYGNSTNRYYFNNGHLLYSEQDKLSKGMSETGTHQTRIIVQWMVFDSTGTAIQAEKQVDGKARAPEQAEGQLVYKHAEVLRNAAKHSKADMHAGAAQSANN